MPKLFENESIKDGRFYITEEFTIKPMVQESTKNSELRKLITESNQENKKLVLKPKIAAIHEGRTRNQTIYIEDKLRGSMVTEGGPSGMYSFLYPYNKPMLKNHDRDSEPTGRVMASQYVKQAEGAGYIMITPHLTDPDTIEKVLDGRYLTVSIGASTDSLICNVCGTDIIKEGWCSHIRGQEYDGTKCGWIVGNIWFDECSWVTVPADTAAKVLDTSEVEVFAGDNKENYNLSTGAAVDESMAKDLGLIDPLLAITGEKGTSDHDPVGVSGPTETQNPPQESSDSTDTEDLTKEPPEVESQEDQEGSQDSDEDKGEEQTETKSDPEGSGDPASTDPAESNEEASEGSSEESEEKPEDTSGEAAAEEDSSEGNAPEEIELLSARISELEEEVRILTENLEEQRREYAALSERFSNFIKEAIKESRHNIEDQVFDENNLAELSVDQLMIEYQKISKLAREKISSLSKYMNCKVNRFEEEEEPEQPDVPPTRTEIFKNLLRGKRN